MKNVLTIIILAATLALSSTAVFAEGILVSDRTGILVSDSPAACTEKKDKGVIADLIGFFEGILVSDRTGILVSDSPSAGCNTNEGILVSDRTGILVSD
jgi:hypothetical protein